MKFSKPSNDTRSANVFDLMPKYGEIPSEFKDWNNKNKWNRAASTWFFEGVNRSQFTVKEGIEADAAFGHLGRVLSDWSPKHEHKEAAVAYLMSLWFDDVKL